MTSIPFFFFLFGEHPHYFIDLFSLHLQQSSLILKKIPYLSPHVIYPITATGESAQGSLGGAVSAHIASQSLLPALCLSIIDVVEGSAIDALQSMQTYLSTRPKSFPSIDQAIQWHLSSRTIRNKESASISVPGLLVQEGGSGGKWIWRTDLGMTQPFWQGIPPTLRTSISILFPPLKMSISILFQDPFCLGILVSGELCLDDVWFFVLGFWR